VRALGRTESSLRVPLAAILGVAAVVREKQVLFRATGSVPVVA
jgi:hypothetical protein